MPNESAGETGCMPNPNMPVNRGREEVHVPFRQVQGLASPARFHIQRRVRRDQGSHVRDVHPHPPAVHTHRVVRGLVALVVDSEAIQVGQVAAVFIGQGRQRQVRRAQRHAQPARVWVDRPIPVAGLQQERVRVLRGLRPAQFAQRPRASRTA